MGTLTQGRKAQAFADALEYEKHLIDDAWIEYMRCRKNLNRQFTKLPHLKGTDALVAFTMELAQCQVEAEKAALAWDKAAQKVARLRSKLDLTQEEYNDAHRVMFGELKPWIVHPLREYATRQTPAVANVAETVAEQREIMRRGHEMMPEWLRPTA